jgi:hypothetical protein
VLSEGTSMAFNFISTLYFTISPVTALHGPLLVSHSEIHVVVVQVDQAICIHFQFESKAALTCGTETTALTLASILYGNNCNTQAHTRCSKTRNSAMIEYAICLNLSFIRLMQND